jgi:lipopolysaccharide/colanic/teichoic acid biosynthesis glycosyltransferase
MSNLTTTRAPKLRLSTETKESDRKIYLSAKRGFDLVASITGLILLSPLLLLIAVAIKLDSRGPMIFRQTRLGQGGREFTMLKFRSMYQDNDEAHHREMVRKTALGIRTVQADGREVYKPASDPRVTRVGHIIRLTCLDELPQLVNVIRGEMSLVGPRPALEYELPYYKDWHFHRFDYKPGITGMWQLKRGSDTNFDDMMRLDIEYGQQSAFFKDVLLVALTIPGVIKQRGVF